MSNELRARVELSCGPSALVLSQRGEMLMRVIGLDIHRAFAEVAILERGKVRHEGRFPLEHKSVIAFGRTLKRSDEVVVEATVNTSIVVRLLRPHVRRVVVANPRQVRVIAHAKVKTDKIDAAVLAKLHASGFLPEVWMPDDETEALRRKLHSKRGGAWLAAQPLPDDQRRVVVRHLDEGGVNVIVALSVLSAIGDVARFSSAEKLVSYFGLNPKVRQSGDRPAACARSRP